MVGNGRPLYSGRLLLTANDRKPQLARTSYDAAHSEWSGKLEGWNEYSGITGRGEVVCAEGEGGVRR
jgi:hypothetical protein